MFRKGSVLEEIFGFLIVIGLIVGFVCGLIHLAAWFESGGNLNSKYHFDGEIGKEKVKFYEEDYNVWNILEVTREDGTHIKYVDDNGGTKFLLDSVVITPKDGEETRYVGWKTIYGKVPEEEL